MSQNVLCLLEVLSPNIPFHALLYSIVRELCFTSSIQNIWTKQFSPPNHNLPETKIGD